MLDASVLVFDADDTLTQTSRYIFNTLQHNMMAQGRYDPDLQEKLDILAHAVSPRTGIPFPIVEQRSLQKRVWEEVISQPNYMLEVEPTELFEYYFKQHHPDMEGKTIALCTHRGWSDKARHFTELWLDRQKPVVTIKEEDCHFLDSRIPDQKNKVAWLRKLYGDDFLLIDDNPFYDRTILYEAHPNIVIYDKYRQYVAYKNQRTLTLG